jgi:hypothetical protein
MMMRDDKHMAKDDRGSKFNDTSLVLDQEENHLVYIVFRIDVDEFIHDIYIYI